MDRHDRVEHRRIEWTIEGNSGFLADTPFHRAGPMLDALDLDRYDITCVEHAGFQDEPAASCRQIEDPGINGTLRGPAKPDSGLDFHAWTTAPRWSVALAYPPVRC